MNKEADKILYSTISNSESLISGFLSGIISRTIMCPFDVVKILIQTSNTPISTIAVIKNIWKNNGIKGFWRGNLGSSINQGPQNALKFFAINKLQNLINKNGNYTPFQRAFIGSLSGIFSQFIVFPLDVINTRITVNPLIYKNFFQTTKKIIKDEGIKGLWKGILPTATGAIIYEGSQYFVYSSIKQYYQINQNKIILNTFDYFLIGAISGAISQTISYPFDIIRKKMMLSKNNEKNSMINCIKLTYKNEGFSGFFRGIGINLIKIMPYTALQYTINEEIQYYFLKKKN